MYRYIINSIAGLLLLLSIASCKKNPSEKTPRPADNMARPVGTPIGDALIETIGSAGGTIRSEDGRMEIEIPSGALTEDTEIKIQAVKNTSASGIGFGYRLTPHGKIFKKNVIIRFYYGNDERRLSNTDALEIAFQNEKGVWICKGGTVNDRLRKAVQVQTDHFSDWGLIASMELTPVIKTVGPGEAVTLKALRYVHPVKDDDFLVPLTIPDATSGEPVKLEQKYIVKWTLDGPGRLDINGNEAIYTAPAEKPATNTSTISVELNVQGRQVLLISTIYIIDEGISLSIDGGPWKTSPGMAATIPELHQYTMTSLRITQDVPQIVFLWPAGQHQKPTGIYSWNMLGRFEDQIVFEYAEPDLRQMYVAIYDDGQETKNSPGFISVEEIQEGGKKYITGFFALDKAGLLDNTNGQQISINGIMGTFKVQRNW